MDQVSLWDEPTIAPSQEDEPITQEEFLRGGRPGTEGQYVRVYYVDDYTPTPGLITGRDCYNAWCIEQQRVAATQRKFGAPDVACRIERDIWMWNGIGPAAQQQFDRMAEHLMKIIASKEEGK